MPRKMPSTSAQGVSAGTGPRHELRAVPGNSKPAPQAVRTVGTFRDPRAHAARPCSPPARCLDALAGDQGWWLGPAACEPRRVGRSPAPNHGVSRLMGSVPTRCCPALSASSSTHGRGDGRGRVGWPFGGSARAGAVGPSRATGQQGKTRRRRRATNRSTRKTNTSAAIRMASRRDRRPARTDYRGPASG